MGEDLAEFLAGLLVGLADERDHLVHRVEIEVTHGRPPIRRGHGNGARSSRFLQPQPLADPETQPATQNPLAAALSGARLPAPLKQI
jgi:hypothetical protein